MNCQEREQAIWACGLTDVGRKRRDNQDQFLIAELRKSMLVHSTSLPLGGDSQLYGGSRGQLLAVADGMGGHAAGQRASSVALEQLISQLLNQVHWFLQIDHDAEEDYTESLKLLLQQAHERILNESRLHHSQRGMGTTLTMAHIVWPRLYVVHAGDSRCYLIREGICEQLTTDHTLARQLVESGGLLPEEEATSRWSHVLWNVLGGSGEQALIAEVSQTDLSAGDTVLLCSDGLSRYVSAEQICEVVHRGGPDVSKICHQLVDLANEAGGEDNITVIVSHPYCTNGDEGEAGFIARHGNAIEMRRQSEAASEEFNLTPGKDSSGLENDSAQEDTLPG